MPQLLLRGFADDNKRPVTFDRVKQKEWPESIETARSRKRLQHRAHGHDEKSDEVERVIGEDIEGRAGAVVRDLREGRWPNTLDEEVALARLVGF